MEGGREEEVEAVEEVEEPRDCEREKMEEEERAEAGLEEGREEEVE